MNRDEATRQINQILKKFEIASGYLVDNIVINDVDVTSMGDRNPQVLRSVRIYTKRIPGQTMARL